MPALEAKPRPRGLLISLLVAAISLLLAAWLGGTSHETFVFRLLHDATQVIGGIALAGAGIGAWIYIWERLRWRAALQTIAVDRFEATLRHVGAIMWAVSYVLFDDWTIARQVNEIFQLPWTEDSESEARKQFDEANNRALELQTGASALRVDALERFGEVAAELSLHCEALWATAKEFDGYLISGHSMPLLRRVADLQRHVRRLIDEGSERSRDPQHGALLLPGALLTVFDAGTAVAIAVRAPLSQLLGTLKDKRLREEIAQQEVSVKLSAATNNFLRQDRALKEQAAEIEAEIERINEKTRATREKAQKLDGLRRGEPAGPT